MLYLEVIAILHQNIWSQFCRYLTYAFYMLYYIFFLLYDISNTHIIYYTLFPHIPSVLTYIFTLLFMFPIHFYSYIILLHVASTIYIVLPVISFKICILNLIFLPIIYNTVRPILFWPTRLIDRIDLCGIKNSSTLSPR